MGRNSKLDPLFTVVYSFLDVVVQLLTSTVYFGDDIGYFNPTSYGKKSGFSYTANLQAQWVTKQKHFFGLGIGNEKLTSRASVDSFYGDMPNGTSASGKVMLTHTYMTLNPFVGHRFFVGPIVLDALVGVDFAFNLNAPKEEAIITSPFKATYRLKKQFPPNDLRPRIQANASYRRVGLAMGYSLGTRNQYYYDNSNYRNKKAYANFLRMGVSYQLK